MGQVSTTFLEAIEAFQLQFDIFDENVELMTFRALRELHEAYPSRSIVEEEQAIKLLMDKLNDPERINWLARFNKSYDVCDVTKPFTNIMEWRTVLTEMFLTIHKDIKEMQTVIRCNITDFIHTKNVVSKKLGKAENKPPNKPSTRMATCTVCGTANHEALTCRSKDSVYANHTTDAYIGSDSHRSYRRTWVLITFGSRMCLLTVTILDRIRERAASPLLRLRLRRSLTQRRLGRIQKMRC